MQIEVFVTDRFGPHVIGMLTIITSNERSFLLISAFGILIANCEWIEAFNWKSLGRFKV